MSELAPSDKMTITREQAIEAIAWLSAAEEVLVALNNDGTTPLSEPFAFAASALYDAVFRTEHPFGDTLDDEPKLFAWPMRIEMYVRGEEYAADTLAKLHQPREGSWSSRPSLLEELYGARRLATRARELAESAAKIREKGSTD
jgi:hypothetical protein